VDRPKLWVTESIDLAEHLPFRLGRLVVDPLARELRFGREIERVEPQPMKVLVALADQRGEVVTRYDLIERCWDGRIVGEDVINRSILLLRRIATTSGAFTIETVPKAGYRLIETAQRRRPMIALGATAAALAIAGLSFFLMRGPPDQSHPPLAVIELAPFVSSGGRLAADAAGASDIVVADMLANSGLPVLKRQGAHAGPSAADLRLSGQARVIGDRIEASLQLDDLMHGTLLLSHRFSASRDQAKYLPEQIGAFAATTLSTTGSLMALDRKRPGDRRLTGELLRQWSMMVVFEDPISSYRAVEPIADQMPNSAVAQLGLAMTTSHVLPLLAPEDRLAALVKGRAAAARARMLAPNYGDVASPDCTLYSPVRMAQCEASLRKAFSIDPNSPFAAAGLRNELVSVGRFQEALNYDELAVAAMPYMGGRLSASTMLLEALGQHARAEQQFQRVRHWWPEFDMIFSDRIEGMLDHGDVENAAAFVAAMPANVDVIDRNAVASIALDMAAKDKQRLRSRCLSPTIAQGLRQFCLVAFVRANDIDGAFMEADQLFPNLMAADREQEDRLFLERPSRLGLELLSTPALAPLRQDPRFTQVAERVGLVRYWRKDHLPDFCTQNHEPLCRRLT
jgi:DNA-binding winged helix-turn-helix (wHTH) protein